MPARRFPPPWSVEETEACFIVRDGNGQALAARRNHVRSWGRNGLLAKMAEPTLMTDRALAAPGLFAVQCPRLAMLLGHPVWRTWRGKYR